MSQTYDKNILSIQLNEIGTVAEDSGQQKVTHIGVQVHADFKVPARKLAQEMEGLAGTILRSVSTEIPTEPLFKKSDVQDNVVFALWQFLVDAKLETLPEIPEETKGILQLRLASKQVPLELLQIMCEGEITEEQALIILYYTPSTL